jgi:hypothetical protein
LPSNCAISRLASSTAPPVAATSLACAPLRVARTGFEGGDLAAEIGNALADQREPVIGLDIGIAHHFGEARDRPVGLGELVQGNPGALAFAGDHHQFGIALAFAEIGHQPLGLERVIVGDLDPLRPVAQFEKPANREDAGEQHEAQIEREEEGDPAADRQAGKPFAQALWCRRARGGAFPCAFGFQIHGDILERAHAATSSSEWLRFCSSSRRSISRAGRAR